MKLSDYRVLTFDCYGTLIDWETGIWEGLQPTLQRYGLTPSRDALLETFARHESAQQAETPAMPYSALLTTVHGRLCREWGVAEDTALAEAFGRSVPDWPAFPDSAESLAYLKQFYKLVILSNVDRVGFAGSNRRLKVEFDAIYTAEDIGSYKPAPRNFDYLLAGVKKDLGLEPSAILHTAQSLFHDHVQATAAGLATAWIDRRRGNEGWGATMPPPGEARIDFHFGSMAEMVEAHRKEQAAG